MLLPASTATAPSRSSTIRSAVDSTLSSPQGVISEASLQRQERLLLSTAFSPPFDYPLQPHPNVRSGALRHAFSLDRFLASPLHQPTVEAFDATLEWISREDPNGDRSIILDSGCGTGRSTRLAALADPTALVLGVDRSEQRLERGSSAETPGNALLVRAELGSFWRLLLSAEEGRLASRVGRHQLLYPNPYPKPGQRGKRWAGHPALPIALQLGSAVELRSNWLPYCLEFREAVVALAYSPVGVGGGGDGGGGGGGGGGGEVPRHVRAAAAALLPARLSVLRLESAAQGLTLFEAKYYEKRDPLYRLQLGGGGAAPSRTPPPPAPAPPPSPPPPPPPPGRKA